MAFAQERHQPTRNSDQSSRLIDYNSVLQKTYARNSNKRQMRKTGSLNNHMQTRKDVCQEKIEILPWKGKIPR